MAQELGPLQKELVAALRSGEFLQGQDTLCRTDIKGVCRRCCLGVAVELAIRHGIVLTVGEQVAFHGYSYNGKETDMPEPVRVLFRFRTTSGTFHNNQEIDNEPDLMGLNDQANWTFEQIAQLIEDRPELIFTAAA